MRRQEILDTLNEQFGILKSMGVKSIALFGSTARDEARPDSDVDILVEFNVPVGLFEFIELRDYLEKLLGIQVDLVTPAALKPQLRESILKEAVYAG